MTVDAPSLEDAVVPPSTARRRRRPGLAGRRSRPDRSTGFLLLLLLVLAVLPVATLLFGSFRDAPPGTVDAGWSIQGWISAYTDPRTLSTFTTSFGLAIVSTLAAASLAVTAAWLVTRSDLPGKRTFERIVLIGVFIPPVVSAISWSVLGNPRAGLLNQVIGAVIGRPTELINIYSFWGLAFHYTTVFAPLAFILVLGAFKAMDSSLEEAARVSGEGVVGTARRVTLPILGGIILGVSILIFVRVLESFEIPQILGVPGGLDVFMTRIYAATSRSLVPNYPLATALAVSVLVVTFGLVLLQMAYVRGRSFVTVSGKAHSGNMAELGRWKWPAFIGMCVAIGVGIGLPLVQIVLASFQQIPGFYVADNWTTTGWRNVLGSSWLWPTLRNTLVFAISGGMIAMVISTMAAYAVVRRKPGGAWIDLLTWMPWGLPGLILGLGLLWGYSRLPGNFSLLGTPTILILAYATFTLPLGARTMTGALNQLNPELEEAGRVHGATTSRTFLRIAFPLLRGSFVFGFAVAFVLASREVGASLLLYGRDTQVISVQVLQAWTDGSALTANVLSCILIAMAGIAILFDAIFTRLFPSSR